MSCSPRVHLLVAVLAASACQSLLSEPDLQTGIVSFEQAEYGAALDHFEPLARDGMAEAQYYLGTMFANGDGIAQDYSSAEDWLTRAAEQGHPTSQIVLGIWYSSGEQAGQDYAKSAQWFLRAAELGEAEAQFHIGTMYAVGQGVDLDPVQAYRWLGRSAAQGFGCGACSAEIDRMVSLMSAEQLAEAKRLAQLTISD